MQQDKFKTDPFFPLSTKPKPELTPIIVVCGKMCSGKDTFAHLLAKHNHIDIGNIVREITQTNDRVQNALLGTEISKRLIVLIKESQPCVITGIRQVSILETILKNFNCELNDFIWLEVSTEERKRRFLARGADKDKNLSFEVYDEKDQKLGLGEIESYFKEGLFNENVHIIEN